MIDPARVGATVAALHQAVRPTDGRPHAWSTAPIGAAGWDALLAEARRQDAPFAERLAALRGELLALEALLIPMEPVQTCHLDLWYDNLRATPSGELCLLDWDNCGPGDPSRELAMVLFDFARTSPERIATLYAAYREAGGPGRVRTPTDFSLLIAQLGHIGAMQLRRWLDPAASDADRALRPARHRGVPGRPTGAGHHRPDPGRRHLTWLSRWSRRASSTSTDADAVRGPGTAWRRSTWTSACLRPVRAATCATSPLISLRRASTSRHDEGPSVSLGSGVQQPGGAPPQLVVPLRQQLGGLRGSEQAGDAEELLVLRRPAGRPSPVCAFPPCSTWANAASASAALPLR